MKTFHYVITDEVGMHARPAGMLVKEAQNHTSKIMVTANGKTVEATKLMALMSLGVKKGTEIVVQVEGEDEEMAANSVEQFFKENL